MSIIPASCLSTSDLALLGNNLDPALRRFKQPIQQSRREVAAVNRSLARVGEKVRTLHRPLLAVSQ